jgi:mono/diheme cytochrome c family protein
MPNTGHDYRLKNLFGWDLRGAQGLYGPGLHGKPFVLPRNLLNETRSAEELRIWLEEGDAETPAYGALLDGKDLADLAAFIVKTARGELARPERIFELDPVAPKGYRLLTGADVARGHARYASACAECHGSDGTRIEIDETQSAGSISRTSGYEIWFKLQHGHPGSSMKRQVSEPTGAGNSQAVLELLAALCDRSKYPALAGQSDVPDGDARCGGYLK